MNEFLKVRLPIRARLTLWYVVLLALTFATVGAYLIFRFQRSLTATVDHALKITVVKTVSALDEEDFLATGRYTFDTVQKSRIESAGFAMRIVSPQGAVWDTFGEIQDVPAWGPAAEGYTNQRGRADEDDQWRVFSRPVVDSNNQTTAWVQAAQSVASINETLSDLRRQLLWGGIPLVLIFAGIGGYFLASRALRPIETITGAAQEINAQDLSRRLAYQGPRDEIGDLAKTFDQMIARLESSFERERRFTGDAAHELRTPLTILKGQVEVTLSRPRNAAEYEQKLHELSAQVDRLIRLSNALLFLSQSDQDQIAFQRTRINLRELLEVLLEQTRPLAAERNIQVIASLEGDHYVGGDQDYLIRLFMNLLENALKYTPSGGQVTVSVESENDECVVAIHNTGAGIPAENIPHLFERFYRVDADRSSQTGGSGLGLAIAQEIARRHGGRIEVHSDASTGVTFSVSLPAAVDPG
jgi:heavy metal sensor kinase